MFLAEACQPLPSPAVQIETTFPVVRVSMNKIFTVVPRTNDGQLVPANRVCAVCFVSYAAVFTPPTTERGVKLAAAAAGAGKSSKAPLTATQDAVLQGSNIRRATVATVCCDVTD